MLAIKSQEASGDSVDTPSVEAISTEVMACSVPTSLPVTLSEPEQVELAQENATRQRMPRVTDWSAFWEGVAEGRRSICP